MPTVHRAISWILNRFGVHRRAVSRTPISGHAYNKAPIYHNHDTFLWAEPMQNRPSTPSDAASALLSGSATIRPQCRGVCLHAIASTAASHGGS